MGGFERERVMILFTLKTKKSAGSGDRKTPAGKSGDYCSSPGKGG